MRYRQGEIEIDVEDLALIVHYEDLEERKARRRRIAIPSPNVDPARVAKEIIRKYEYIHPSRLEEVEQKVIMLLAAAQRHAELHLLQQQQHQQQQQRMRNNAVDHNNRCDGRATLAELDTYLELLYEGGDDQTPKIQGTAKLLELCEQVEGLELLVQNQTLMGALTRVLQDEFKRSLELTFNILRIFLACSNYLEMHNILSHHKVGLHTMKVIEFELQRTQVREQEYAAKIAQYDQELRHGTASASEIAKRKSSELARKLRFEKRQDKVLFVGFFILMNFAEDISVERKMIKRGIIEMLCSVLTRSGVDVLVLAITFLKKLSVFEENKAVMTNTIPMLVRLLSCDSDTVIHVTLRLLFNLSFDSAMREKMLGNGMLPKLTELLKKKAQERSRVLKLLYHLSVEDRCKSMFTFTEEGISIILGLIINYPKERLTKDVAALAVNLSLNHRNAELMAKDGNLTHLMLRLQQTNDPLLMKIIRNISLWTFTAQTATPNGANEYGYRGLWSPHVKPLMQLAKTTDSQELLVEVLGTLANLTINDLPVRSWLTLLQDCEFAPSICRWLVPGLCQNDVILEVIMFMAQVASDKNCSTFFAASTLIALAEQTWRDKAEDTEIVLQSMFLFYWLFQWPDTREEAFRGTRVVLLMIDALQHRNEAVQQWADRCLHILVANSEATGSTLGDLQERIKWHRFEAYNRQWVRMTNNGTHWVDDTDPPQSLRQMMQASMLSINNDVAVPSNRSWRTLLDQDGDLDYEMMKAQLDLDSLGMSEQYYMNDIEWPSRWN